MHPSQLLRWGPAGDGGYLVVVPLRPHLEKWLDRARRQMAVEAEVALCTVFCVVRRWR